MGLSGLSQLPPSARAALGAGEVLLAWQPVELASGESRIGRTGPPRAVTGVDLNPLSSLSGGPLDVDPGLFDRWVGGVSLTGQVSSLADILSRALSGTVSKRVAVTTERVILFSEGATTFGHDPATGRKTWDAATEQLWEVPLSSVLSARVKARPLMAGRLVLMFEDDSSAALMCGMVSGRGARRLRDSLSPSTRG